MQHVQCYLFVRQKGVQDKKGDDRCEKGKNSGASGGKDEGREHEEECAEDTPRDGGHEVPVERSSLVWG